jgi:hypothetical protein
MRNDARPVGHDNSHQSPVVSHQSPVVSHQSPVVSHQSPVVSPQSDVVGRQSQVERRPPQSTVDDQLPGLLDLDGDDPVMPTNDSTLKIRI